MKYRDLVFMKGIILQAKDLYLLMMEKLSLKSIEVSSGQTPCIYCKCVLLAGKMPLS